MGSLLEQKIAAEDFADKDVSSIEENMVVGRAEWLKARFDSAAKEVITPKVNGLIDALLSQEAAGQIGAAPLMEGSEATVAGQMAFLKEELNGVSLGQIPSGSLTDDKLSDAPGQLKDSVAGKLDKTQLATAEENGVTYALENHGMFAGKASQVKNILDSVGSPALKSTADTGNFLLVCNDPVEAVSLLIDDIAHVHFKDFKKVESGGYEAQDGTHYIGTAIGDGQVDLKKIVALLREKGYDGFLSIEYEGSDADNLEAITHSIEFTNSIL